MLLRLTLQPAGDEVYANERPRLTAPQKDIAILDKQLWKANAGNHNRKTYHR